MIAVCLMDAVHSQKQPSDDGASDHSSDAKSLPVNRVVSPEPDENIVIEAMAIPANENQGSNGDPLPRSKKLRKKLAMAAHFEDFGSN